MYQSSLRNPAGYVRVTSDGASEEHDTQQCVHCGAVWEFRPGSGRTRGFCVRCMGVTCGNPACDACVPIEARLDHMEGRKSRYTDTIQQLIREGALVL